MGIHPMPPRQAKKSAMSRYARPAHKRAARALGFALTLGTEPDWWVFSALINRLLTDQEKTALAYFALMAMDEHQTQITAEAALWSVVREMAA